MKYQQKTKYIWTVLIVLITLIKLEIIGQQYPFVNFTLENSLPGNQVWDIYQDSKGYIWLATTAGLIRHDGQNHILFNETSGLTGYFAYNISEDSKGNVWFGCPAGVAYFDMKSGTMSGIEIGSFNNSYKVYVDSYDRVWIYDFQLPGDVFVFEKDSIVNYSHEYSFHKQRILDIDEDSNGKVYLLTADAKMYTFFAQQFKEVEFNEYVNTVFPRMFFFDSQDNLILCGPKGSARLRIKDKIKNYKIEWMIKIPTMYGLQDKKNVYWFASVKDGLFRYFEDDVTKIDESNGLTTSSLFTLYNDRENNLWIGTNLKGVIRFSSLRFANFGKNEGFKDEAILTLYRDNNTFYCGTENSLYTFSEPRFENYFLKENINTPLPDAVTLSILKVDEKILMGRSLGLYEIDSSGKSKLLGLGKYIVYSLIKDSQNKVWVGTNDGLFRWSGGTTFTRQTLGVDDIYINALLEINNKDLFIATTKGLLLGENYTSEFHEKSVKLFTSKEGLPSNNVLSLTKDNDANIIIGTSHGLAILSPEGELKEINSDFYNDIFVDVFVDSECRLWAGTNNGLHLLVKHEDNYVLRSVFFIGDGLASNEFTRSSTIVETEDGRIWFGTYGGLSVYDPSEEPTNLVKPMCYITYVALNDDSRADLNKSEFVFSYTENKIKFGIQAPSFFNEANIKFEYYLHPIEKPWTNVTNSREITYSFLNPGSYTFYTRMTNAFGVQSDVQEFTFVIKPPFWKTTFFYFLLAVLIAISGYLVHYYRSRKIRLNNIKLEKLVNIKTSELQESKDKITQQYKQLLLAQEQLVEKSKLEKAYAEISLLKDRLTIENIYLKEKQGISAEIDSIVGKSDAMQDIREQIIEVADTETTVLISGETGTGKNLAAAAIHFLSRRKNHALISVNCAAIPSGLIESELFGHEKGAFTGAHDQHIGKFELANESTIFLDEIGDMSLALQSKLLTVLQEKKFVRVGGRKIIEVDVRVIAASNQNLEVLVDKGKFRRDLLYRLNVFQINIPPLRDRIEDVEILTKFFVEEYSREMNKKVKGISKSALKVLMDYEFPGNVRELGNIIQRAVLLCKGDTITDEHIVIKIVSTINNNQNYFEMEEQLSLEEMEKKYIIDVLEGTQWRIHGENGAAAMLGINPNTLRSKMRKLGIPFKKEIL